MGLAALGCGKGSSRQSADDAGTTPTSCTPHGAATTAPAETAEPSAATGPYLWKNVTITAGGLATSGTTRRRWRRGGRTVHHIVDPRTGDIPASRWRTVSVAAATCVDANTASTAAVVLGDAAPGWLAARGLPARLVDVDGAVSTTAGWPESHERSAV